MLIRPTKNGGRHIQIDSDYLMMDMHLADTATGTLMVVQEDGTVVGQIDNCTIMDSRKEVTRSGIGSALHDIILDRYGADSCRACDIEKQRLNKMTADQVEQQIEYIAEQIRQRATQRASTWLQRVAAKIAPHLARQKIIALIREAIRAARV